MAQPLDNPARAFRYVAPVVASDGWAVPFETSPGLALPGRSPRHIAELIPISETALRIAHGGFVRGRVSDLIPPALELPFRAGPSAAQPCRAGAAVVVEKENVRALHNAEHFGEGELPCLCSGGTSR